MSIDHVCLRVPGAQYKEMVDWYLAALKPIGFQKFAEPTDSACGLGVHRPDFWMAKHDADKSSIPVHIGFKAEDRKAVDEFHKAALAAGAKDNGAPGLRPMYHPNYYGAFVLDPAGNNIEVVCHKPEVAE